MFVSRVEIVSFLAAASLMGHANAAGGAVFSYDPTADLGPSNWGDVDVDDNQCEGEKNSPIAVEKSACTRFEDYSFSVSTVKSMFKDINECILLSSLTPTLLIMSSFFIGHSSSSERRLYIR
jgi:carbonic anhydrase